MKEDEITLTYSSLRPLYCWVSSSIKILTLESIDPLKASYFLERRGVWIQYWRYGCVVVEGKNL
jgi:4-deoxy-L-threo-5-hexosulose-uronate ketol-isomerase